MKLIEEVVKNKEYAIELRRYFHAHPELSLKEYNTAKKIEEELDKLNIEHIGVGETGVCGFIKGRNPKKVIAIRADIDALPIEEKTEKTYKSQNTGIMHACGHDGHTASLLLTAKILKELEFDGEIRLFFQQSEENGQGARQFVKAGLLKDVDEVIGYHGWSSFKIGEVAVTKGPVMASCDYFKVDVIGKATHVSEPDKGIDALYLASKMIVEIKDKINELSTAEDPVIVGIGKMNSGTVYNIVSGSASFEGTYRTFDVSTRKKVNELIHKITNDISSSSGAKVNVEIRNYANTLVNDEFVSKRFSEVAEEFADKVITNDSKRLGSDDFADFAEVTKGCYMFVGTQNDEDKDTTSPQHNEHFDIDENSMLLASSIIVSYVREFFKGEK